MPHTAQHTDEITLQTPEQRQLAERGAADLGITIPETITTKALADIPTPVVDTTEPETTPITPLPQVEIPKEEAPQDDIAASSAETNLLLQSLEATLGESDRISGRVTPQVATSRRKLIEANERLARFETRAIKAEEEALRQGRTLGFARGEAAIVRREALIEAKTIAASVQAATGNLRLALDLSKETIADEFEALETKQRRLRANIINNFDNMTPEQQRRATETLRKLDATDEFLAQRRADKEAIRKAVFNAVEERGITDSDLIEDSLKSANASEALALINSRLGVPQPTELESLKLERERLEVEKLRGEVTGGAGGVQTGKSPITGKVFTTTQSQAGTFATRMESSESVLSGGKGFFVPFLPKTFRSAERRAFEQAETNFITAVLRRESGAAIAESEFVDARKVYIPLATDDDFTLRRKAVARSIVFQGLVNESVGAFEQLRATVGGNNFVDSSGNSFKLPN